MDFVSECECFFLQQSMLAIRNTRRVLLVPVPAEVVGVSPSSASSSLKKWTLPSAFGAHHFLCPGIFLNGAHRGIRSMRHQFQIRQSLQSAASHSRRPSLATLSSSDCHSPYAASSRVHLCILIFFFDVPKLSFKRALSLTRLSKLYCLRPTHSLLPTAASSYFALPR